MFSSVVSLNVATVTDSTCLSAVIVYVFLPVVASTVGFPIVTRSPAVISVPKSVIAFLPSLVILDKSSFANPVALTFTEPSPSFVIAILSPFTRLTFLSVGSTTAPFTANFHSSAFFANPASLNVSFTSEPLAVVVM